jgi:hypothetical protein
MKVDMTRHFYQRCKERLPGVKPKEFAAGVQWAMVNSRTDALQYLGREKHERCGRMRYLRRFRFHVPTGEAFNLLVSQETPQRVTLVTVHPEAQE